MVSTVLLVDDHPLVRRGIISVLSSESSLQVVGEAETTKQGLEALDKLRPDLVLTDIRLGDGNGLELIEEAKKLNIKCKFVILTSSSNEQDFLTAEHLGASGYLLKESLPEEIVHALRVISQGRKYYDPGVISIKVRGAQVMNEDLTVREKEVLSALGRGLSNKDIAAQLFVSENTVKKHVSQVLAKLNLEDRTQAALYAYSRGLVSVFQ